MFTKPGIDTDDEQAQGSSHHPSLALASVITEDETRDVVVSAMTRRQAEWDRQLESVDQKQTELMTIQWKLVREQTGTLARELAIMQQQLKDIKVDSRRALIEVERYFRENEGKLNEERGLRLAMYESLEQRLKKIKHEVESEAKQRAVSDAEIPPKLEALAEALDTRSRETAQLDGEMRKLNEAIAANIQELSVLRDTVAQEADERRCGEETARGCLREVREAINKEIRDRTAADDDLGQALRSVIEQEKADRNLAASSFRTQFNTLQKDLLPYKEELPALRTRMQEIENALQSRLKDGQKSMERDLGERAAAHIKLERKVTDMAALLDKEGMARSAMAEESEQMLKSFRTKMQNILYEQNEAARFAREELQNQLAEQIEKEVATRETQHAAMMDQLSGHRAAFDVKADAIESGFRGLEQQHREERAAEYREFEANQLKFAEEVARQLREFRESFGARLAEERATREAHDASLEENIDFMDHFLQDVRELFLQKGSRQRQLVARKTAMSTTSRTSSPAPRT